VLAAHRCIRQQPPLGPNRDTRLVVDLCTPDGCHAVKSDGHFSLNPRRVLLTELLYNILFCFFFFHTRGVYDIPIVYYRIYIYSFPAFPVEVNQSNAGGGRARLSAPRGFIASKYYCTIITLQYIAVPNVLYFIIIILFTRGLINYYAIRSNGEPPRCSGTHHNIMLLLLL